MYALAADLVEHEDSSVADEPAGPSAPVVATDNPPAVFVTAAASPATRTSPTSDEPPVERRVVEAPPDPRAEQAQPKRDGAARTPRRGAVTPAEATTAA